ncbi:MAG: endonuclease/exonuclease/phosphatase family protein [Eubacteriales bacterium]|nr:endonuclease/exonuclease/phosphatase family protein [Eubacteriales bacterium]
MSIRLKVMTFNLSCDDDPAAKRLTTFQHRAPRIYEMLQREKPDLIGFQEATDRMRASLTETLLPLGYAVAGCGRDTDYHGESTVVAYRRDQFELLNLETRWLSLTPDVPGSSFGGDQSGCPRIYTAATLCHRALEKPFVFLNTHLDHVGRNARLLGVSQILQRLSEQGLHFIITGDMNAEPDDAEIKCFTAKPVCGAPVCDATAGLGDTYHGYGKDAPMKIDYVFTDFACDPSAARVLPDAPVEGIWLSDHYPVAAVVEIA